MDTTDRAWCPESTKEAAALLDDAIATCLQVADWLDTIPEGRAAEIRTLARDQLRDAASLARRRLEELVIRVTIARLESEQVRVRAIRATREAEKLDGATRELWRRQLVRIAGEDLASGDPERIAAWEQVTREVTE